MGNQVNTQRILDYIAQALQAIVTLGPVGGSIVTLWQATSARVQEWVTTGTDPTDQDFADLEAQILTLRQELHGGS